MKSLFLIILQKDNKIAIEGDRNKRNQVLEIFVL